jgi:hypothetical protein
MWLVISKKKHRATLDAVRKWQEIFLEKEAKINELTAFLTPRPAYLGSPQARIDSKIPQWEREEKEWGDEAYGSGNVVITAKAIDEGDDKEPGYTRASMHFAEDEDKDPPALAAAKATTEEAGFPEPDTID